MSDASLLSRIRSTTGKITTTGAKQLLLLGMVVSALYPVYFVFVNAFKSKVEYASNRIGLPQDFTLANFAKAFEGPNLGRWFANTILLTVCSVVLCLLAGALAAFALSRMQFRGRIFFLNGTISLMVVPTIVMVLPLFVFVGRLGMTNTFPSVIIIYSGMLMPFTIYLLYCFFVTLPQALIDSALIDGCSNLQTFTYILLPLSRPAIVALSVVNVLWVWNELLISLIFLQTESTRTLMVGLTLMRGRFSLDVPLIMAGLAVATLPMLILYAIGQKALVRGLVAGAVKGE